MLASRNSKIGSTIKSSQTMQQTGILTLTEYKQMRDRIQTDSLTEEQQRKLQERKTLKEISDAKVKNWPNTVQNNRKKKDDARYEKFQQQEEERRKIDVEEANYKAAVKQEIIGKANKQIYEANDRVKAFQGALLYADVLQEREAQIEIAKQRKEMQRIVNDQYSQMEKDNMREYDLRVEEKQRAEEEKKRAAQQILKEQHDQAKLKYIKKLQENKIEGEIIKLKAQEALERQKEEEMIKKERILSAQRETKKSNDLLKEVREQERLRDLERDNEIKAFAKKKEEITEMRRMREDIKFREKQEARQKIIDAQVEKLRQIKNKEDEIINKQIKEAEMKAEENERIKKEKRDQLVKEIDQQIDLTLQKRQAEKEKAKIDDKNFQDFWRQKNQQLEERDQADKEAQRERNKNLSEYHKKQAAQKQRKLEDEIQKEFDDALRMKAAVAEEDRVFQSYAEKCLSEWDSNGKNVKPLLLELQKYKKKTN